LNWLKEALKEVKDNAEGTCKRKETTLKNIEANLVEWDITQANPLQTLKINKGCNEKEIKYWNINGVCRTINYIGFFIGARISEILNIKWGNADFVNNRIRIQSSSLFRAKKITNSGLYKVLLDNR
jgi:integrase